MDKPIGNLPPNTSAELSTRQVTGDPFFWGAVRELVQKSQFTHVHIEPPLDKPTAPAEAERPLDLGWATRSDLDAAVKDLKGDEATLRFTTGCWLLLGRALTDGIASYDWKPQTYVDNGCYVNLNTLQTYLENIERHLGGPNHGLNDKQVGIRLLGVLPRGVGVEAFRVWKRLVERRASQLAAGDGETKEEVI